jgi:hypothetical protein
MKVTQKQHVNWREGKEPRAVQLKMKAKELLITGMALSITAIPFTWMIIDHIDHL